MAHPRENMDGTRTKSALLVDQAGLAFIFESDAVNFVVNAQIAKVAANVIVVASHVIT